MQYNIDLRFALPLLLNILTNLIKYVSSVEGQDNQVSSWGRFITDQNVWLHIITLAFVLLVFAISIKLTVFVTLSAEPIILRFGDFNLSLPLGFLMIASVNFPPQSLLYAYLICISIWISPFPRRVFDKIRDWLQQFPVFIITAQQQPNDLQAPAYRYSDDEENIEINVLA